MKKLLFVLFVLAGGIPALAQQQVLDPSFAQNGILSKSGGVLQHIISLPSRNLIATGSYIEGDTGYTVLSCTPNGETNTSFAHGGMISGYNASFSATGKIKTILSEKHIYFPITLPIVGWAITKYDTLGNKVLSFGKNGFVGGTSIQFLDAFTLDNQDRVLASKSTGTNQGHGTKVLRLLQNGDLDSTFGTNGVSTIITENDGSDVMGLYVLSDKRILAGESGGGGAGTWMSVRFMPNGGPDYSYGDSGKVILPLPGYYMRGTIVQPDKKVLQWGDSDSLQVIRLKENGSFDSTFGINGKMRYREAKMRTMLLMNDGRILLGGDTEDSMFAIYRLMPNGKMDTSFGVDGIVRIKLRPGGEHQMNDLAIQADGKLLAGGYTSNGLPYPSWVFYFTIVRFMPDGRLDLSFVPPVSKSAGMLLYPNPTERTILIQKTEAYKGKVQLQIVDMTGRVVFVKEYEQMGTQAVQIEVGNLVPGMYQAVLKEASGKTWREPFVKR